MIIRQKIISILLISMISVSSFVRCEIDPKHKKHLVAGAYLVLAGYSAEKAVDTIPFLLDCLVASKKIKSRHRERALALGVMCLHGVVKFSVFSYLTYFGLKNAIQELRKENKEKVEMQNS